MYSTPGCPGACINETIYFIYHIIPAAYCYNVQECDASGLPWQYTAGLKKCLYAYAVVSMQRGICSTTYLCLSKRNQGKNIQPTPGYPESVQGDGMLQRFTFFGKAI